jgi:hypothetical protein
VSVERVSPGLALFLSSHVPIFCYVILSSHYRFSVAKALKKVETILDTTRSPRLAEEEEHKYDDKYALIEFLTNTSVAAQMNALERLGLTSELMATVSQWVHNDNKTVTLRFQAQDTCTFLKEQQVELAMDRGYETTTTTTTTGSASADAVSPTETASTSTGGSYFGKMVSGGGGGNNSSSQKTETTKTTVTSRVKEFHFKVGVSYKIVIFAGTDPLSQENSVVLQTRDTSTIVVTSGGQSTVSRAPTNPPTPIPESTIHPPVDANLTWFFKMIAPEEQICQFQIERNPDTNHTEGAPNKETCKTPRRNQDVDAAVEFNQSLFDWTRITQGFFLQGVETEIMGKHNPVKKNSSSLAGDTATATAAARLDPGARCSLMGLQKEANFNGKLVNVIEYDSKQDRYRVEAVDPSSGLPPTLLIKRANLKAEQSAMYGGRLSSITADQVFCPIVPLMEEQSVLHMADVGEFLGEQNRSIDETIEYLSKIYPPRQLVKLISIAEATIVLMCQHMQHLTLMYHDSVDYVEDMLKQQLIQAIGKEIVTKDFDQFMRFHNQKLFGNKYAPTPFSYAVRRPKHFPDGILTIEGTLQKNEPINTMVRTIAGSEAPSIYIPINAATSIEITGDRHLHGWLQHRFPVKPFEQYQLIARARQFSSFLVVVGTMAGSDKFDPKDAIILQNKDEVLIPLLTNVLPTAKEFKDAVVSLSPDQKAFAESFRAMQLESSVFGVCVIQLKPQLEKLLELPEGALTKEIQLTQDLMSLFVDYQIPSDLLSFDGAADSDLPTKVNKVKDYVKSVLDVIESSKEKQLIEEERKADMMAERSSYDGAERAADNGVAESVSSRSPGGSRRRLMAKPSAAMAFGSPLVQAPGAGGGAWARGTNVRPDGTKVRRVFKSQLATPGSVRLEQIQPGQTKEPLGPSDVSIPVSGGSTSGEEDFTLIPKLLDQKLEKYDTSNALRSTIIKTGPKWIRMRQENLLTPIKSSYLAPHDIETEKKKAFDLLDAISRSGTLSIACAELHVVVAVSHCFDNDLMGTIIQDNINPIEKVERSSLMIASTIYGEPVQTLIEDEHDLERLTGSFPLLFAEESE